MRGLLVAMPDACRCGAATAVIGSSKAMHHAKLVCGQCGKFRAWMSAEAFNFVAAVIDVAGRPTAPIIIRNSNSEKES